MPAGAWGWDDELVNSPSSRLDPLPAAVEAANGAIARFLRSLPGGVARLPEDRVRLAELQGQWDAAVAELGRGAESRAA